MAYTLTDQFRPLRLVLRVNGTMLGLALGSSLSLMSKTGLSNWGLYETGTLWPFRLAGAMLVMLGLVFWIVASQEEISFSLLLTVALTNALVAFVLLSAYLQQEFSALTTLGRMGLIVVFALCLIGAIVPLPYLRAENRY
jgi:FtsH-binding integral membrane protein